MSVLIRLYVSLFVSSIIFFSVLLFFFVPLHRGYVSDQPDKSHVIP